MRVRPAALAVTVTVAALLACTAPPAPPPAPAPKACDLAMDKLDGRSFVREDAGKIDTWARAQFFVDGDKLKVRYNVRSPFDMYTYTCKKAPKGMECLQDKPDLQQWCQTLIANKGSCSPADLAELTGAPVEAAKKAHEELMDKVKKLKPDEVEKMKKAFSLPSNQLRGVFNFSINSKECTLAVRDLYQTMTEGKLRELENFVGNSRFVPTDQELVWEHCPDVAKLVALESADAKPPPGQTKVDWAPGAEVTFRVTAEDALAKPKAGCTYSMDHFFDFALVEKGVPVQGDGKLAWTARHTLQEPGRHFVDLYRYEACGGGEAKCVDRVCSMVKVGQ